MKQKLVIIASAVMLALSAAPDAWAQWVRTNWPSDSNSAATCFAGSGSILFAGTEWSGIYRSTDSGASWVPASNGFIGGNYADYVEALAILDTNLSPPILFASTDNGLFLTTNNGASWTASNNGLMGRAVDAVVTIDTNLFVGTDSSVFRSTDKGGSWTEMSTGLPNKAGANLTVSGKNLFASTDSGLYLSTNDGGSWVKTNTGLIAGGEIGDIAVIDSNLFAGTDSGVFLSLDNGISWNSVNTGLPENSRYIEALTVSGSNLFAASGSYIFLSTDNGSSWTNVGWDQSGWASASTIISLGVNSTYLFAGVGLNYAVLRKPLSQIISPSAVAATPPAQNSITSYPNPFFQSTIVSFSSPESGETEVTIVNLLGTEVKRIFSGELSTGEHEFSWDASGMPPGMYECVVWSNGKVQQIPIILAR